MKKDNQRRTPRNFEWSQTARDIVRANLHVKGPELRDLIARISEETGNPRDACLRFARRLGVKAKRAYRKWTAEEQKQLENELELHKVRRVSAGLERTPNQVYAMMHRLGISGTKKLDRIPMYAVARLICKHPRIVRQWIQSGALEAENEGTDQVPRWVISPMNLQRFLKNHHEIITARHVDRARLRFILGYVFPSKRAVGRKKSKMHRQSGGRKRKKKMPAKPAHRPTP